MFKPFNDW